MTIDATDSINIMAPIAICKPVAICSGFTPFVSAAFWATASISVRASSVFFCCAY